MLLYRLICAALMALAIERVLARPEAADLLARLPEMAVISPLAAAAVGFVNLASRQGWGGVVALANGIWAGLLSISLSGILCLASCWAWVLLAGLAGDVAGLMTVLESRMLPLLGEAAKPFLILFTIAVTAMVGLFSEVLHWALLRIRQSREGLDKRLPVDQ